MLYDDDGLIRGWNVQYGGEFTKTVPLSADEWRFTCLLGFVALPLGKLMRLVPVKENLGRKEM